MSDGETASLIKALGKAALEPLARLKGYLAERTRLNSEPRTFWTLLVERARQEAIEFAWAHQDKAMMFPRREGLWDYCLQNSLRDGLILEFGVFDGYSINHFADKLRSQEDPRLIYGFDSFEGLIEDWIGRGLPQAHFDRKGRLPRVRPNVRLVKGWIDQTLPGFLQEHPGEKVGFLHIDTDTYSPAKTVLQCCKPLLQVGTIIVFDELLGYPGWRNHEHKALIETLPDAPYEFIAFSGDQVAIRIIEAP